MRFRHGSQGTGGGYFGGKRIGLPWEGEIELTPSPELVELVRLSQKLASASVEEDA